VSTRRILAAAFVAVVAGAALATCGGSPPASPTPGGGGGGGVGTTPNTPPVVKSITAADSRVEVGSPVTLTATVEDAETPIADLTYAWTADTGTFAGTGAQVTWTPGADAKTPGDFVLTLTVTERYTTLSGPAENKATGTISVHVNNSPKELADLSLRFLGDFANSKISPEACVSQFSDATSKCAAGKRDELDDVRVNRHDYEMIASTLRHSGLTIAPDRLGATVHTFCSFTVKVISPDPIDEPCLNGKCPLGSQGTSTGDCWTTNVYEQGRWWLCESHFTPLPALTQPGTFAPTIFRHRGL
jgi:hypothetical protein